MRLKSYLKSNFEPLSDVVTRFLPLHAQTLCSLKSVLVLAQLVKDMKTYLIEAQFTKAFKSQACLFSVDHWVNIMESA